MYCPSCKKSFPGSYGIPTRCPDCNVNLVVSLDKPEAQKDTPMSQSSAGGGMIGWGIFIFIAGIIGFLFSGPKMDEIRSGLGRFAIAIDQSSANQAQMWQIVYYGSIVALILGGILFLGGIIVNSLQKK